MADIVPDLPPYHLCDHVTTDDLLKQRELGMEIMKIRPADEDYSSEEDKRILEREIGHTQKVIDWIDGLIEYRKNRIK